MFETLARVMTSPEDRLTIVCEACGRRTVWSRREAFSRYGADASPFVVRRRSRCGRCGERTRIAVTI